MAVLDVAYRHLQLELDLMRRLSHGEAVVLVQDRLADFSRRAARRRRFSTRPSTSGIEIPVDRVCLGVSGNVATTLGPFRENLLRRIRRHFLVMAELFCMPAPSAGQ